MDYEIRRLTPELAEDYDVQPAAVIPQRQMDPEMPVSRDTLKKTKR